jgi:1-acyl-sn-glycerol-3-phosphate acyltransferase
LKLRGYLALALVCLTLLVLDPVQRLVIGPWVRLFPSRRIAVLSRWQHAMAQIVLGLTHHVGGAHIPELPGIRGRPGTLVLMNHQSLLDIPIVVASTRETYARIVTRKRYERWIPLISHMVRLYQYPVVDPTANPGSARRSLEALSVAARESQVPLVVFPEGTRTKDGEIGRFKIHGLRHILAERAWSVYLIVTDGFWKRAKFTHFMSGMSAIEGSVRVLGPFDWPGPEANSPGDAEAFAREMRERMIETLAGMRSGVVT